MDLLGPKYNYYNRVINIKINQLLVTKIYYELIYTTNILLNNATQYTTQKYTIF